MPDSASPLTALPGCWFRVQSLRSRVLDLGLWGFEFGGFGFGVLDLEFWVSGFGDLRCRIFGF